MSHTGRLEDLDICTILQLISLGKKSGTLSLDDGRDQGSISFLDGQVVRTSSSRFPASLGDLLSERNLVSAAQLEEAVVFQQRLRTHQPLGAIITYLHQVPAALIEEVVAGQIERILIDFCCWTRGAFIYRLEPVAAYGSALLNPLDLMLEKGLSPHRIALKSQYLKRCEATSGMSDELLEQKLQQLLKRQSRGRVDLLRGMLSELESSDRSGGIILLILRYASELMRRAVIFDVRGSRLVGLGQFGLSANRGTADRLVRQLNLELCGDSLLARVISEKKLTRGTLADSPCEERLRALIPAVPADILLAPLVSEGRVVALLYGDGFYPVDPVPAFDAFAVFLTQAGIAMEQALQSGH